MDYLSKTSELTSGVINKTFSNDFFRMLSFVIVSVFIGYTLQPVPKWLNNLFDKSIVLKFIVMLLVGITAVYPLDKSKTLNIVISSAIILLLFEGARYIDKFIEKNKERQEEKLKQD